jgi:hypothetical protein
MREGLGVEEMMMRCGSEYVMWGVEKMTIRWGSEYVMWGEVGIWMRV